MAPPFFFLSRGKIMSFIFRNRNKYDDLCSIDVGNSNEGLGWLLLLALTSMSEYPKIVDKYSDGTASKIETLLNEGTISNQEGYCFNVRPIDPLKMGESISKPYSCNPFEGYSREEIEMLLDYRGKEI